MGARKMMAFMSSKNGTHAAKKKKNQYKTHAESVKLDPTSLKKYNMSVTDKLRNGERLTSDLWPPTSNTRHSAGAGISPSVPIV
jgi:hypothetical protein